MMATLAMLQSLLPALVLLGGFAAAPQQWHPRSPCVDDTDCALNGACSASGACTCSSGWSGPACETLELLPAQPVGAYGYAPNISSWGAVVVAINDTYHMYAAEFWNNCGVQSFYTNCHIVHAEATRPEGPFRYVDTALGAFSGNPQVIAMKGGGLALFHIGNGMPHGVGPLVNCSGKDGHATQPMPQEHWPTQTPPGPAFGGIHTSLHPEGPWSLASGLPSDSAPPGSCENPAPMQHSNGTLFLVCNEGPKVLYSAASPAGPWTKVGGIQDASNTPTVEGTPTQWANTSVWEDPFIWQDTAGHWHVICHAYPPVVRAKCGECALHYGDVVAGHGFSKDGTPGSWTWSSTPPFTRYVNFTGGNPTLSYGTRERPYLLFEHGVPVALYTSVTYPGSPQKEGPNDASFVLMQAVKKH
jgi:hypothetical protein